MILFIEEVVHGYLQQMGKINTWNLILEVGLFFTIKRTRF